MVPFGRVSEWLHKEDERSLGRFEGAVFKRGVVCDAPSSPAHAKGREKERERERERASGSGGKSLLSTSSAASRPKAKTQ